MSPGRLLAVAVALAGLAACEKTDPLAPPAVHFGSDVCDVCGMIISDERFASAVVMRQDGAYVSAIFDDIGCLLGLEAEGAAAGVAARYVRAFSDRQWVAAEEAVYLHSGDLHTPMAFGVAACRDRAEAERVQADFPGPLLSWEALRERFARGDLGPGSGDAPEGGPPAGAGGGGSGEPDR